MYFLCDKLYKGGCVCVDPQAYTVIGISQSKKKKKKRKERNISQLMIVRMKVDYNKF